MYAPPGRSAELWGETFSLLTARSSPESSISCVCSSGKKRALARRNESCLLRLPLYFWNFPADGGHFFSSVSYISSSVAFQIIAQNWCSSCHNLSQIEHRGILLNVHPRFLLTRTLTCFKAYFTQFPLFHSFFLQFISATLLIFFWEFSYNHLLRPNPIDNHSRFTSQVVWKVIKLEQNFI